MIGATTACSIFMASMTTTAWWAVTDAPWRARTATTRPGMGATRVAVALARRLRLRGGPPPRSMAGEPRRTRATARRRRHAPRRRRGRRPGRTCPPGRNAGERDAPLHLPMLDPEHGGGVEPPASRPRTAIGRLQQQRGRLPVVARRGPVVPAALGPRSYRCASDLLARRAGRSASGGTADWSGRRGPWWHRAPSAVRSSAPVPVRPVGDQLCEHRVVPIGHVVAGADRPCRRARPRATAARRRRPVAGRKPDSGSSA